MPTEPTLENFTLYTYTVLWTTTFLLLIRRGFVDRASPYPATALLCAFPWNIVYLLNFHPPFALVDWIGVVYFCVGDSFMTYFLFRYSRDEPSSSPYRSSPPVPRIEHPHSTGFAREDTRHRQSAVGQLALFWSTNGS